MLIDSQLLQIGASLISGGAVGALITAVITSHRARIQPVGRRMTVLPLFQTGEPASALSAKVSIEQEGASFTFDNLFIVTLELINRGNQDLEEFPFGLTFQNGDRAIHFESASLDRHHTCVTKTTVNPAEPHSEIDFVLTPFNRGDIYAFRIYAVSPHNNKNLSEVLVSSVKPVRFEDRPDARELMQSVMIEWTSSVLRQVR